MTRDFFIEARFYGVWIALTFFLRRVRERALIRVAYLLPRSLVYWAVIRFTNAATNCGNPRGLEWDEMMDRNADWYQP